MTAIHNINDVLVKCQSALMDIKFRCALKETEAIVEMMVRYSIGLTNGSDLQHHDIVFDDHKDQYDSMAVYDKRTDTFEEFNDAFKSFFSDINKSGLPINVYLFEAKYRTAWRTWKMNDNKNYDVLAAKLQELNSNLEYDAIYLDDQEVLDDFDWDEDDEDFDEKDISCYHEQRDKSVAEMSSTLFDFLPLAMTPSCMFDPEPNVGNNFFFLDANGITDQDSDETVWEKDNIAIQEVVKRRMFLRNCRKIYSKTCRIISRKITYMRVIKAAKEAGFPSLAAYLCLLHPDADIPQTSKRLLMYIEMLFFKRNVVNVFSYNKPTRYEPKKKHRKEYNPEECQKRLQEFFPDVTDFEPLRKKAEASLEKMREYVHRGVEVLDTKGSLGSLSCGSIHPSLASEIVERDLFGARSSAVMALSQNEEIMVEELSHLNDWTMLVPESKSKKKKPATVPSTISAIDRIEPIAYKVKSNSIIEEDFAGRLVQKVAKKKTSQETINQENQLVNVSRVSEEARKWFNIEGTGNMAMTKHPNLSYVVADDEFRRTQLSRMAPLSLGYTATPAGKRVKKGYDWCVVNSNDVNRGYLANVIVPPPPSKIYLSSDGRSRKERIFSESFVQSGSVDIAFSQLKVSTYRCGPISWLQNATKLLKRDNICSISDPRLHAYNDPMRLYMVYALGMAHGTKQNFLDPRIDYCPVSGRLTDAQTAQLLDAFYWRYFCKDINVRRSMDDVLNFYVIHGWEIQIQDRFDREFLARKKKNAGKTSTSTSKKTPKCKRISTKKDKIEERDSEDDEEDYIFRDDDDDDELETALKEALTEAAIDDEINQTNQRIQRKSQPKKKPSSDKRKVVPKEPKTRTKPSETKKRRRRGKSDEEEEDSDYICPEPATHFRLGDNPRSCRSKVSTNKATAQSKKNKG